MGRPTSTSAWPKRGQRIDNLASYARPPGRGRPGLRVSASGRLSYMTPFDCWLRNPAPNVLILASRHEVHRTDLCCLRRAVVANGPRIAHTQPISPGLHRQIGKHTSELQSPYDLVCRLLLEKKK